MRIRFIGFGVQMLIAAMLGALLAVPATAHPEHVHETSARVAAAALDALIVQAGFDEYGEAGQVIAAPAHPVVSSCCCCGQNGCCTGTGCAEMICGSGSCGQGGNVLVWSHDGHVALLAMKASAAHSDQLLPGKTLGPEDRPPRV